jgi:branched-chain amino acid transport system ATP-binding protein
MESPALAPARLLAAVPAGSAPPSACRRGGTALVELQGIAVNFGGVNALTGISFEIRSSEILGLIGPNGAGKTTLFNVLTRLVPPSAGEVRVDGRSVLGAGPHRLARLGVARTFQNLALFGGQSVLDNVRIGAHTRVRSGWLGDALRLPGARRAARAIDDIVWPLLERLALASHAGRTVGELPFALQKRVELARALAAGPRLLLLDEPAGGLNQDDVQALAELLRALRTELGLAILLVEHHMGLVAATADRVVVLNFGRKIAEGTPAEMRAHPDVVEAYLGATAEGAA